MASASEEPPNNDVNDSPTGMADNTQENPSGRATPPGSVETDAPGGTPADNPPRARGTDAAAPKDGEDDDDAAALARMMAFQEEQEPGAAAAETTDASDAAHGAPETDADGAAFDPNVAFLGDAPGGGGDANDDAHDAAAVHPNHNNPAAVALRRRQALQDAARRDPDAALRDRPYVVRQLLRILRPSLRYTPLSLAAATLLLLRTLRTRQQFYLALAYLQSSKLAYILLGNTVIALAVSAFALLTRLFLDGGLRPNERDSIGEHIRWDVTETCLALTIFRSELDVLTAIEFLALVILKCLHWSVELRGNHLRMTEEVFVYPDEEEDDDETDAEDRRIQRMKRPWYRRVPRFRFTHVRYYALVQLLILLDVFAVAHCALSVATHGPSVDIFFGFECAILLVAALSAVGGYHLHVIDGVMGVLHHLAEGEHHHVPVGGMAEVDEDEDERARRHSLQEQQEGAQDDGAAEDGPPVTRTKTLAKILVERLANPWRDRRATFSFAIELQAQAAKFMFYVVLFAVVFTYYGMPINIFRDVYVSFQQLRRRLTAFNTYRRLTHNMDQRFETIKDEEELDRLGRTCIICREQMDLRGGCVKLPGCGHAFHAHCLREWLVQQQTCPTCRADIAANEARAKKQRERERAAAAAVAEQAARDAAAGDVNDAAPADATTPAEGSGTDADADASQPQPRGQTRSEQTTSPAGVRGGQQPTSSTSAPGSALPDGWTQHTDATGRTYYYNIELNQSSWEKPASRSTDVAQPAEQTNAASNIAASNGNSVTNDAPMATVHFGNGTLASLPPSGLSLLHQVTPQSGFPCLYQITLPTGAPIFSSAEILPTALLSSFTTDASTASPQRFIPCGKLIVCTSMEYWPAPFQQAMLRMPDGYVRSKDVKRFLMLGKASRGGVHEVKMNAVGVAH